MTPFLAVNSPQHKVHVAMSPRTSAEEDTIHQWLLSHRVEDWDLALGREHDLGNTSESLGDEDQLGSKGEPTDQRAIIIDVNSSSVDTPNDDLGEAGSKTLDRDCCESPFLHLSGHTDGSYESDDADDSSVMLLQEWLCGECGKDSLLDTGLGLVCQYCVVSTILSEGCNVP